MPAYTNVEGAPPRVREVERLVNEVAWLLGVEMRYPRTRWSVLALTRTLEKVNETRRRTGEGHLGQGPVWNEVVRTRDWDSLMSVRDARLCVQRDISVARERVREAAGRVKECDDEHAKAMRVLEETSTQERKRREAEVQEREQELKALLLELESLSPAKTNVEEENLSALDRVAPDAV